MTGAELKLLRKERNMGQAQLAAFLGGACHASTVSRWERQNSEVPPLVAQKMLASSELTLPLEVMQRLLSHAAHHKLSFRAILSRAILEYLARA